MSNIEKKTQTLPNGASSQQMNLSSEAGLQIAEDWLRKEYLTRLPAMSVVPMEHESPLEKDILENVRLYHITEMVYQKGELATEKFATVFNTIATYNASVFIILDSNGERTDFYIGVRNNETDETRKRSSVSLGDTLRNTLVGNFPGIKVDSVDRSSICAMSERMKSNHNISSVSVLGSPKAETVKTNEHFIQGLEKLILAMQGRKYTGVVIAENQQPEKIQYVKHVLQDLYTAISPYQKMQLSKNETRGTVRAQSFSEMDNKQKLAAIGAALATAAGAAIGIGDKETGAIAGGIVGGQLARFIQLQAPAAQINYGSSKSLSYTVENRQVKDLLTQLDWLLKRINEFESYGMWNVAGYFLSDEMSAAEMAASNYRSLMNGDRSGNEVAAINSWRDSNESREAFQHLSAYISRFEHPHFYYGNSEEGVLDATTSISGKELGLHIGLPRASTPGLPVIEHAEFGKEVNVYSLLKEQSSLRPEDRMILGKVFDLGQVTQKTVELDNKSLNMHTFITGSTGSGKSNTVYQMLNELHQDRIPFLVIEPAKGEYKDVFGHWPDVHVFSTNPNVAKLMNINPFMFPSSIHVLEHIDGLVEIFSVCWPMYDAMPAFFKDAILRSYEYVGWDLGSSTFEGEETIYPNFEILAEQLDSLIEESDYASDIKSNYRGALITRVKSLTIGLNKYIFTAEQTPYIQLFDENCILDISRVKSTETKALIMGLMVYILNEYRMDRKTESNLDLKHVTVLEEAHNLLKNKTGNDAELVGKSVEMLTQTIAEVRTYGEGFIIVDQSPSSVDIAAIKNTNTKIVLRTPEANDREAIGRSMGLTEDQVNEIAKLPSGVAVVYQNNWLAPVLAMIDKANILEVPYRHHQIETIRPLKEARTGLLAALLQPWLNKEQYDEDDLLQSLKVLDLKHKDREVIADYLNDYAFLDGEMVWTESEIPGLQNAIKAVLHITSKEFDEILENESADDLRNIVKSRTVGFTASDIDEICNVLTKVVE